MADQDLRYRDVLRFWFSEDARPNWFERSDAFDRDITAKFKSLHTEADAGELDAWMAAPDSALALIIVLDQFSRNMYRGTPQAFASDARALAYAKEALASGYLARLDYEQRQFIYLPFMHSEDLAEQHRSVELCEAHDDEELVGFAVEHRDIIARFGRFAHRNQILSRASTPEETEFLKTHSGF